MDPVLSKPEVRALTDKVRYGAQIRVLKALGLEYKVRPDGSPAVSRQHFNEVFGSADKTDSADSQPVKLNLEALDETEA